MFTYIQSTGELFDSRGHCLSVGYSGHGLGKNNPSAEAVHDIGPIPAGLWRIGEPFDSEDHGPFALRLEAMAGTLTHGRSGFLMHGDAVKAPGTASKGCIVQPRSTREAVAESSDKILCVVAEAIVATFLGAAPAEAQKVKAHEQT
jgi:hypothetical protein